MIKITGLILGWVFVLSTVVIANESIDSLSIHSDKDALSKIQYDSFGKVSLKKLREDIDNDIVYRSSHTYGRVTVAIESDNDPKHFGGISFSFNGRKAKLDVTGKEVEKHLMSLGKVKKGDINGGDSYHWKSNGFSCMVDFNTDMNLFEYLCHYIEQ